MSVRNDGKKLEELVFEFENIAKKSGYKLELNKKNYLDNGIQVSEFDIYLYSENGHKILFECRDRPSQGRAPANWIEQLYGRKYLNELDKVIAVSTTGFSEGAIINAKKAEIELWTAEKLSQPVNWLTSSLNIVSKTGTFKHMKVFLEDESDENLNELKKVMPKSPGMTLLKFEKFQKPISPSIFIQNFCSSACLEQYDRIERTNIPENIKILYLSKNGQLGKVNLIIGNQSFSLSRLILIAELNVKKYIEDFKSIDILKQSHNSETKRQKLSTDSTFDGKRYSFIEVYNDDNTKNLFLKIE